MMKMTPFGFGRQIRRAQGALALGALMGKMVKAAAHRVEAEAKRSCPFDEGRLRASYHTKQMGANRWRVGTNVFYAPYVEFGTGDVGEAMYQKILEDEPNITFSSDWRGVRARPHLRPAAAKGRRLINRMGRSLVRKTIGR